MSLVGKTIAITGAFGALGTAVVQVLQARGASVAAIDRADAPRDPAALGAASLHGGVDLGDAASAAAALDAIARRHGRLDGLVNIAGGFAWEKVQGGSLDTWDKLYQMNLRTAVAATQAALPHLPDGGRIINIGANGAVKAGAGMGAYAASKAGVMRLTEALAEELKPRGITVNALLPSIIDTPANRADMPDADFGAWVQPAQLAATIAFLLSDEAGAITGALIPVTGRV
ncbi:SDR family oxidoreductase [Arenimonas caeni]|jgi:NAD(P)-dependent dehydrogenase (short-subunit alcohol dehydrogenase family)|uniref:SDR family oxidoreductase n=1 Tax=Arenimonas caeni TaxID=2058085 RepID=UPI002A3659BC|nr:SDR family oxidoreductase [Arenimonas caeni]MDY0022134.1 SDR family oxidoreductase [Arenimonas caeni]